MDIHQERELKNVRDGVLLKKMLSFAGPYWKIILFSVVLAALIVASTIAQPYLIKVAIDDRINGIYYPMIEIESSNVKSVSDQLAGEGLSTDSPVIWNDRGYIRIKSKTEDLAETAVLTNYQKVQIVKLNQEEQSPLVLIRDWAASKDTVTGLTEKEGQTLVSINGGEIPAYVLTSEDIDIFRGPDYTGFVILAVLFFITVIGTSLLNYYQINILQNTGQSIIYDIRQKMFSHLTKMDTAYYDKNPVGRLVTRVSHDVEALNQMYSQVIVNLVKEVCMLIGIIFVMFHMSVKLTLISFIVIPVLAAITFYYRRMNRNIQRYTRIILSRLNSFLAENLAGMRIIQMFTREEKQLKQFDSMNNEYYRAGMKGTIINSIFNPAIGFLGNIALALIIWYGGLHVLEGAVAIGVVYAFTHYVRQFYQPLLGLADRYNQIQTAMASAERIFEMMDEKPAITNPVQPVKLAEKITGRIEFDRVWFAYEEENWVLKDINFTVEPGETVAFVGATGAGKSSIINLINRFYDVQKGSIRIDGVDVRDINVADLRRHVGVIQQDAHVFTGDVNFNIRLNADWISDEELRKATISLKMDEFIRQLPSQYNTLLGEQGVVLSSGQKQMLSFLRAFVFNPDILILDEATANIDTETEQIIQEGLKRISKGRTTLIVAHRLSTIQHADKIIVMHKGQIREIGNHYQLLRQKGYYHRLYELQNTEEEKYPSTS
jgi:ATP-binding cassette subfamily B multidrug efflux pump